MHFLKVPNAPAAKTFPTSRFPFFASSVLVTRNTALNLVLLSRKFRIGVASTTMSDLSAKSSKLASLSGVTQPFVNTLHAESRTKV